LALAGSAQGSNPLTSEQMGDILDARRRAKDDIAHRAHMRRLARLTQRNQKEPTTLFGRTTGRIAIGVAGVAAATSIGLTIPAAIADLDAASGHYQTVLGIEENVADSLSPQAKIILNSELKPVQASLTSPWPDFEAGQKLGRILQAETTALGAGASSWGPIIEAQQELSSGNNAQSNSEVPALAGVISVLSTTSAGVLAWRGRKYQT
jgi:hypothetical protein